MSLNLLSKMIAAFCGSALAGLTAAGASGHAAPWWVAIVVGALGTAFGVLSQSPVDHQAIAERKANLPPPAAAVLLAVGLAAVSGCAHVKPVAETCGPAAASVVFDVATALEGDDYEAALARLAPVAECVIAEAVKQVVNGNGAAKAALDPVAAIRAAHGRAWLKARNIESWNFPLDGSRRRVQVRYAMTLMRTWPISQLGHEAPAAALCVRGQDFNATRAQVSGSYSQKLETKGGRPIG